MSLDEKTERLERIAALADKLSDQEIRKRLGVEIDEAKYADLWRLLDIELVEHFG